MQKLFCLPSGHDDGAAQLGPGCPPFSSKGHLGFLSHSEGKEALRTLANPVVFTPVPAPPCRAPEELELWGGNEMTLWGARSFPYGMGF